MAQFPKTEQGTIALAERMIAGLTEHADDFPAVTTASVQTMLDDYKLRLDEYGDAQALVKTTLTQKDDAFGALVQVMKSDLKQAEVDVGAATDKLYEIGWGPRSQPQPLMPPNFPGNLRSVAEGQGAISLAWDKPASGGGAVRNYIIERCQAIQGGGYGEWTIAGSTYNCEISLTDQPMDAKLQYVVRASNAAGESVPSNSVYIMLP